MRSKKAVKFLTREDSKMNNSPVVISEDDDYDDTTISPPAVKRNIASELSNARTRRVEKFASQGESYPTCLSCSSKGKNDSSGGKSCGYESIFQEGL